MNLEIYSAPNKIEQDHSNLASFYVNEDLKSNRILYNFIRFGKKFGGKIQTQRMV